MAQIRTSFFGDIAGDYAIIAQLSDSKVLITKKTNGKYSNEEAFITPDHDLETLIKQHTREFNPEATTIASGRIKKHEEDLNLPKFDDELQLQPHNNPTDLTPSIPSIGSSDVQPTDKYPSMKPYLDPLSGPSAHGFNGMIVDKNHPIFGQHPGNEGGIPDDHPLGARYDDPMLRDESVGMGLPQGSLRRGTGGGPGGFGGPPGNAGFPGGSGGNPFGGFI